MTLNPQAVGLESSESTLSFDWKTLALYPLGIGSKRSELDYLYEARGPKVFPTFAVVPGYPVLLDLLGRSGGSLLQVVHATQSVRVLGPLPRLENNGSGLQRNAAKQLLFVVFYHCHICSFCRFKNSDTGGRQEK